MANDLDAMLRQIDADFEDNGYTLDATQAIIIKTAVCDYLEGIEEINCD